MAVDYVYLLSDYYLSDQRQRPKYCGKYALVVERSEWKVVHLKHYRR